MEKMITEGGVEGRQYTANVNILLVDDDITTLNIVSAMLKTWSYQVVTVLSPIDAISILRKGKCSFDLVVTDLHMPQMNGMELQKLVRNEFELPVIMMSADDKESVILKSLEEGSVYYMVKPVSREDLQMVWKYVLQSRKIKSSTVTLDELRVDIGAPGDVASRQPRMQDSAAPDVDIDCMSFNKDNKDNKDKEGHKSKGESDKKNVRKRDEDKGDSNGKGEKQDRRLLARKKAKVVWSSELHSQFLLAIKHLGLDKAVPKRILEIMNVSGLTRENVASHLQKYRMFLKRVVEKARLSKYATDSLLTSSLALNLPTTSASFNNVQRDHYAEFLKQHIMNDMLLTSPNNLATLGGSSSFQPSALTLANIDAECHNRFGSGQSRLLVNNALQQQRAMQFGNNGMNMFAQPNKSSCFGGFGNNVMNNDGSGIMNGGFTDWMDIRSQPTQAKQFQRALNFTSNPFNFGNTPGSSTPTLDNLMSCKNNAIRRSSFGVRANQPAAGFDNVMNGGHNGLVINNDVVNRNIGSSVVSARFETSGANPFALGNIHQPQNGSMTLSQPNQYGISSFSGVGNNDFPLSALTNNSMRNLNKVFLANDDDDMMVINNLVMQQLENQPPLHQKQGGEQAPINSYSIFYQDKVATPIAKSAMDAQAKLNSTTNPTYGQAQQITSIQVPNSQVKLNPNTSVDGEAHQLNITNPSVNGGDQQNPNLNANTQSENISPTVRSQVQLDSAVNDQVELNPIRFPNTLNLDRAANDDHVDLNPTETLTGNPNLTFGSVFNSQLGDQVNEIINQVENENVPSWIMGEQGSDQLMVNSDLPSSMFEPDNYSGLLDHHFTFENLDDDFLNGWW